MAFRRNHGGFASGFQRLDHALIRVKRLVRQQRLCRHPWHKRICSGQIVDLARGQENLQRIAQRVREYVKLAAQAVLSVIAPLRWIE
jgi:hypothetical protein